MSAVLVARRFGVGSQGDLAVLLAREELAPVMLMLDVVQPWWAILVVAALVAFWLARSLAARAYVKVQRE